MHSDPVGLAGCNKQRTVHNVFTGALKTKTVHQTFCNYAHVFVHKALLPPLATIPRPAAAAAAAVQCIPQWVGGLSGGVRKITSHPHT